MPRDALIMFAVAAIFGLAGAWMLLQLRKPLPEGRVYAYRIAGIMAASGAAALALSAAYLWSWSAPAPAPVTPSASQE